MFISSCKAHTCQYTLFYTRQALRYTAHDAALTPSSKHGSHASHLHGVDELFVQCSYESTQAGGAASISEAPPLWRLELTLGMYKMEEGESKLEE